MENINEQEQLEQEYLTQTPNIQWFPGHMAKTRRVMKESLKLVDIVVELRDARIPKSSRNPEIEKIVGDKPRLVVFNKADIADPAVTKEWQEYYKSHGVRTLALDCRSGKGLKELVPAVRQELHDLLEKRKARGMESRPIRMMIVGVPNVGKSSLINRLAGGKRVKVEDRPGVTRGKQWVRLESGIELLDMPGVLWPKFDDRQVGERLAYASHQDDVYDLEWVAMRFLNAAPALSAALQQRFKVTEQEYEAWSRLTCSAGGQKARYDAARRGGQHRARRRHRAGRVPLRQDRAHLARAPARRPGEGAADNRTIRRRGCQMIEETSLFRYDEQLRREGYLSLCGVDEAGRGPLAGPVVAAAVILPEDALQRCPQLAVLNDSKKLSEKKREALFRPVKATALGFGIGQASWEKSTSSTSCRLPFWRCAGRWSRWSSNFI